MAWFRCKHTHIHTHRFVLRMGSELSSDWSLTAATTHWAETNVMPPASLLLPSAPNISIRSSCLLAPQSGWLADSRCVRQRLSHRCTQRCLAASELRSALYWMDEGAAGSCHAQPEVYCDRVALCSLMMTIRSLECGSPKLWIASIEAHLLTCQVRGLQPTVKR